MQHKIIIPTGYMGSGSSAVTDLLSEVGGYACPNGNFEYVFMHCPNGVFDLEDKLLAGNNALRGDEALHTFYNCMQNLYYNKHYWVADYARKISPDFLSWCDDFIDSLIDEKTKDVYWYYQENPTITLYIKKMISKLIKNISLGRIKLKPALRYRELWISYPTEEKFYAEAKRLLNRFFNQMGAEEANIILDQFVLPHNLYRVHNYFDDNCKVIVVDRDPRDVFLLNKYYWTRVNAAVPYSFDVKKFCNNYDKMRCSEKPYDGTNVKRIHFEDLVYDYNKTVDSIFSFLEIPKEMHYYPKKKFIPEQSEKNTQIFNRSPQFIEEAKYIEEHLQYYLYDFPVEKHEELTIENTIL